MKPSRLATLALLSLLPVAASACADRATHIRGLGDNRFLITGYTNAPEGVIWQGKYDPEKNEFTYRRIELTRP